MMQLQAIRALTLDLDDTLWPVAPVIAAAEAALRCWIEEHAPATAAAFDAAAMRGLRLQIERDRPELVHDLGALRIETLRRAVACAGEPAALADRAFEVFHAARQQVVFYPEVLPALRRLARRYPLLSVSNGNACLHRIGVADLFFGSVNARDAGVAKPDPRIFALACRRLGCEPAQVLHVGDDLELDVRAAQSAGMRACWLRRDVGTMPATTAITTAERPGSADFDGFTPDATVADLDQLALQLGCVGDA